MTAVAEVTPARERAVQHPSVAERAARGKAARKCVPRVQQAFWGPDADRRGHSC